MNPELVVEGLRAASGASVDLRASAGDVVALIGPPGSGTSQVLVQIAGLVEPAEGSVLLGGAPPHPATVGVMRQPSRLFQELTAFENVSLPLIARGRAADPVAVEAVLSSLLLAPSTWHNLVEQLSGGQQQRVAIARALVSASPLVCLDEPVTELDEASVEAVWTALRAAATGGAVVVLATSDPELAARCDLIVEVPSATGP